MVLACVHAVHAVVDTDVEDVVGDDRLGVGEADVAARVHLEGVVPAPADGVVADNRPQAGTQGLASVPSYAVPNRHP